MSQGYDSFNAQHSRILSWQQGLAGGESVGIGTTTRKNFVFQPFLISSLFSSIQNLLLLRLLKYSHSLRKSTSLKRPSEPVRGIVPHTHLLVLTRFSDRAHQLRIMLPSLARLAGLLPAEYTVFTTSFMRLYLRLL
jgi:hypothetical protein